MFLNTGETMFPPRAPFFAEASDRPRVRFGESAVSPARAGGDSTNDGRTV